MLLYKLLFLFIQSNILVYCPMIVTRGTPEVYVNSISFVLIWEECLTNCTGNDLCVAVHTIGDGNCQIFEFGDLQTVKRSNDIESKFAYKVKNENASTCPADDTIGETNFIIGINGTSDREVSVEYTVSFDQTSQLWNFQSMRPRLCPNHRYKMFKRELGPWCMAFVVHVDCKNYTSSASYCTSMPTSILKRADSWNWFNASYPLYAVWVSGFRKPECVGNASCQGLSAFSFADPTLSTNPTGFLFNPGKPDGTGADCLAFRVNSDRTCGIDNIQCNQDRTSDNSTCITGEVCGLPPS
ncbi:hypothetical protein GCK72_007120 [Caenorhabditis remanei]|uniref:PAN-3 domain-containing protein n=1 Tax=Caenorhabditis remanei TaxID=31234 RepID=A0A6A5HJ39_CAERE|nr:hypothetical protein GCK72_007120 [Caenorhabditis remanei]KAF1767161.1 hypothetical protein GCK72_007120 [Caenorhabditis remanei]